MSTKNQSKYKPMVRYFGTCGCPIKNVCPMFFLLQWKGVRLRDWARSSFLTNPKHEVDLDECHSNRYVPREEFRTQLCPRVFMTMPGHRSQPTQWLFHDSIFPNSIDSRFVAILLFVAQWDHKNFSQNNRLLKGLLKNSSRIVVPWMVLRRWT